MVLSNKKLLKKIDAKIRFPFFPLLVDLLSLSLLFLSSPLLLFADFHQHKQTKIEDLKNTLQLLEDELEVF